MAKKRKSKSMLPALLIGGGVLAYFLFVKKDNVQTVPDVEGGGGQIVDDGSGTGTPVIQPPPIVAPPSTVTNLQTAAAINDREALLRYSTDPVFQSEIKKLNDAETINVYNYVMNYVVLGKRLYQYPNASGIFSDGGWDTALYNAIAAIKMKYNLFK